MGSKPIDHMNDQMNFYLRADTVAVKELVNRVSEVWTPACWFGFFTEALPEIGGYPAHFLVACWEPQNAPALPQLPHAAAIVARTSVQAANELLRLIPAQVPIILLKRDFVNVALIAEMILTTDRHLNSHYRNALEEFVENDRASWRLRIEASYSDVDDSFEKFKLKLLNSSQPTDSSADEPPVN